MLLSVLGLVPSTAFGQSAITGAVRDTTGSVLPGVTVEASSPALIEKVRTATTDEQGRYRIVDLRPGVYTVTFTLTGFNAVKHEAISLEAAFTATVNEEMRIGGIAETIIVTGAAPVVDVTQTERREAVNRDLVDVLPSSRNYQTVGRIVPGVSMSGGMSRFDVGGSTSMWQGQMVAFGGRGLDFAMEVDGMNVSLNTGNGQNSGNYLNEAAYQEYIYQMSAGSGETQTPGVKLNMIPREGGNQFKGTGVALFANTDTQSKNATEELRSRGLTTPGALYKLYDYNFSLGGPIMRDRLWFFTSARRWAVNNYVANAFNPDGSQAIDDNALQGYNNRLTYQATTSNKITAAYDKSPKYRGHRDIEFGGVDPKATVVQTCPLCYYGQFKWTSTVSSRILVEGGYSTNFFGFHTGYRPEVILPSAGSLFGDIAKIDLILNTRFNAAATDSYSIWHRQQVISAVSYITGSHALKTGISYIWGTGRNSTIRNADLVQRYRNGVPDSVDIANTPRFTQVATKADIGIYVQDSWRKSRLTVNPSLRFEYFNGVVPEQDAPAGRFVSARHFDRITNLPNWKDIAPRIGAAYDVFGNGKTAIKGSVGKYMNQEGLRFPEVYNPMSASSDIRTWTDLNHDDIAQEAELGPSTNSSFGIRRSLNPDPDIRRSYQVLYTGGLQHELRSGLGVSLNYYRREYYNLTWTDNLATTFDDYTLLSIPDPLKGAGQTLPVYNLARSKLGLIDQRDANASNIRQTFDGLDFTLSARFSNGATVLGGMATGRTVSVACQVDDPNSLRFCDATQYDNPLQTTLKLSGVYPLPYGIRASAVFQSEPGDPFVINYLVNRTIVPTLTVAQVTVPLNEPGSLFLERVNQLDFGVSKVFSIWRRRVKPQVDIFNALNVSPVISQVNVFGPLLNAPRTILPGRLLRLGVQIDF